MNEEFRRQYQDVIENSEVSDDGHSRNGELQPSVYELAGRVWMLMSRRKESQSVVYQ
jgi:chitin synthase